MRVKGPVLIVLFSAAAAFAQPAAPGAAASGKDTLVTMRDGKGTTVGVVKLTEVPNGVLMHVQLAQVSPGVHGFHIHETGKCEPPFTSAGGHFNPAHKDHGIASNSGMHAGDLPNLTVPESGKLTIDLFAPGVSFRGGAAPLFDSDNSSLVLHAGPDDYRTNPSGGSGDRIACGVIEPIDNVSAGSLEVETP